MSIKEEFKETKVHDLHIYFSNERGTISLIKLRNCLYEEAPYEIYCLEGELFEDIERFSTIIGAIDRIKKELGDEK
jgi:hypothetical protein